MIALSKRTNMDFCQACRMIELSDHFCCIELHQFFGVSKEFDIIINQQLDQYKSKQSRYRKSIKQKYMEKRNHILHKIRVKLDIQDKNSLDNQLHKIIHEYVQYLSNRGKLSGQLLIVIEDIAKYHDQILDVYSKGAISDNINHDVIFTSLSCLSKHYYKKDDDCIIKQTAPYILRIIKTVISLHSKDPYQIIKGNDEKLLRALSIQEIRGTAMYDYSDEIIKFIYDLLEYMFVISPVQDRPCTIYYTPPLWPILLGRYGRHFYTAGYHHEHLIEPTMVLKSSQYDMMQLCLEQFIKWQNKDDNGSKPVWLNNHLSHKLPIEKIHCIKLFFENMGKLQNLQWYRYSYVIHRFINGFCTGKIKYGDRWDQSRREILKCLLMNKGVRRSLINHGIFFIFLQKKDRGFIELLWRLDRDQLIDICDGDGNDVMLFICGIRGKTERIIEYLVNHGAKIDRTNNKNETVFDRLKQINKHHLIPFLSQFKSDLDNQAQSE